MRYEVPITRKPVEKIGPVGLCIYCKRAFPSDHLTDEHVIADGLGGDLVLAEASCLDCAKKTCRVETSLMTGILQFARSVAEVRSRKRKSVERSVSVQRENAPEGDYTDFVIDARAPFILLFPTTSGLPGILRGGLPWESVPLHLSLFGDRDWNKQGQSWLSGNGTFAIKFKAHAGVIGQALAKTAHAYACAKLGVDGFSPLLVDYILAHEPAFNAHLIASLPSGSDEPLAALHIIDIQATKSRRWTVLGISEEWVYVVVLRLFANRPSPAFLIVVGTPVGPLNPSVRILDAQIR